MHLIKLVSCLVCAALCSSCTGWSFSVTPAKIQGPTVNYYWTQPFQFQQEVGVCPVPAEQEKEFYKLKVE